MNKKEKVYFCTGFIISLASCFVFLSPLISNASFNPDGDCNVSEQTVDSISNFKNINSSNIDTYLALLTKAHAELKCDKTSINEILQNIQNKNLSYADKKEKIKKTLRIQTPSPKEINESCSTFNFENLVNTKDFDQQEYLKLLKEFSINCT